MIQGEGARSESTVPVSALSDNERRLLFLRSTGPKDFCARRDILIENR